MDESSMSSGAPPPGWYVDPAGSPHLRWWDGQAWTDHLQPPEGSDLPPPPPPRQRSGALTALLIVLAVVGAITLLLAGACIVLLTATAP